MAYVAEVVLTISKLHDGVNPWIHTNDNEIRYPEYSIQEDGKTLSFLIDKQTSSIGFYQSQGNNMVCHIGQKIAQNKLLALCEGKPIKIDLKKEMVSCLSKMGDKTGSVYFEAIEN